MQIANAEGQRVYTITQDNISQILPLIEANSQVKNDIQKAVVAGQTAMIHERPIEYQEYVGSGYVLLDPETGTGAYKISGGGNGAVHSKAFAIGLLFAALTLLFPLGLLLTQGGVSRIFGRVSRYRGHVGFLACNFCIPF